MLLLIENTLKNISVSHHIQIHRMLLLIALTDFVKANVLKIQIHRMLLLIAVAFIVLPLFKDSNTSYVAINPAPLIGAPVSAPIQIHRMLLLIMRKLQSKNRGDGIQIHRMLLLIKTKHSVFYLRLLIQIHRMLLLIYKRLPTATYRVLIQIHRMLLLILHHQEKM